MRLWSCLLLQALVYASLTFLRQLKRMMAYIGTPESHRQVLTRSPLSLAVVVVV